MPVVAAARAAAVRAFFGEAMRRMKETDTENLFVGDKGPPQAATVTVWCAVGPYVGAATPGGSWRLATSSREAGPNRVRNDPFY